MKYILKLAVPVLFIAAMSLQGCEGAPPPTMDQIYDYQDSMLHGIAGVGAVQARVDRDFNTEALVLKLYVRDVGFYSTSPEKMQEAAVKAGQMAITVFG